MQIYDRGPREPTFGQKFGAAIGSGVGQGVREHLEEKEMAKKLAAENAQKERELEKENQDIFESTGAKLFGIKGKKEREQAFKAHLEKTQQEELFKHQKEMQNEKFKLQGEQLKSEGPKGPDQKELEAIETKDRAQTAFNEMTSLLRGGNLGRGSGLWAAAGGKPARDIGKFTSLTGALEAMLVDKVSRGTLSNERFKYITETLLPKSSDSDDTIEGKMEGLAEILGLDTSALTGKSQESGQQKTSSVGSKKRSLTSFDR